MLLYIIRKEIGNPKNIYKILKAKRKIKKLKLFDEEYYLDKYPKAKSMINPLDHYIYHGYLENKTPSKLFDGNYYLYKYPDVKKNNLNPLIHYVLYGKDESRFKNKNEELYSTKNLYSNLKKQEKKITKQTTQIKKQEKKLIKQEIHIREINGELNYQKKKQLREAKNKLYKYTRIFNTKHINKEKIASEIENFKEYGITKEKRTPKLIVSLTSFPERMYDIHYTLYSLLTQKVSPDEILLWLSTEEFPNLEEDVPKKVLEMKNNGLTIKWCEDIKSYNKLIFALKGYPEDIIVTADDDVFYPTNWLEQLYENYDGKNVICHRAHLMTFENGILTPYEKWEKVIQSDEVTILNFFTGVGGVLYPPKVFYKDILDKNLFMKLSPTADDIWFWAMTVMNNRGIKIVKKGYKNLNYVNVERELGFNDDKTLYLLNGREGKNDEQIISILEHYPEIQTKLLKEIPKVSVIIPVYNTEKYLEKCLDSVLNQTLEGIEVICINDGSTDNSLEILRNYEKKIKIKIINQKNQGSGVARNKGLEIAKGEYIGFIDSDDWISEDYYEVLYQNAKKSNADISATCQVIFPEKGKKDVGFDGTKLLQTIDSKGKMILTSGVIWNKVYRREFIIKNKICFSSRKSIGEDNIFNIFGAILSNYIVTTDKVNYYWRQRKSSRSSEKRTEKDLLLLNNYQGILNKLQGLKINQKIRKKWQEIIYDRAKRDFRWLIRDSDEIIGEKVVESVNKMFPELKFKEI